MKKKVLSLVLALMMIFAFSVTLTAVSYTHLESRLLSRKKSWSR